MEINREVLQLLGFFIGLGVLYGGIRADLKSLHRQSQRTHKMAVSANDRIRKHASRQRGMSCPHAVERRRAPICNG